jgi:hypothetical protein
MVVDVVILRQESAIMSIVLIISMLERVQIVVNVGVNVLCLINA